MADAEDQLYGVALEQFVPERSVLAKALRTAGDREAAARVAKLPKPSVAAWAVNQLVRTQRAQLASLFDAGDAVIAAQSSLLDGSGDAGSLRDAAQREREAVDALVVTARGLLSSSGNELSQSMLDRISATLNAAALDEDAREQVRAGRLVRELEHVGFAGALGFGGAPPATRKATATRATAKAPGREAGRSAKEIRDAARASERERAEGLRAAKHAEADARRAAELAVRKLEVARERRDRAAAALEQAEADLAAAGARVEETAAEHSAAEAELRRRQGGG